MIRMAQIGQYNPFGQSNADKLSTLRAKAAAISNEVQKKINRGRTLSAQIHQLLAARKTAISEQKALFAERLRAIIEQATADAKNAADAAQKAADPVEAEQLIQTADAKATEAENALQVLLVEVQNPDTTGAATSPLNQPKPGEGAFPIVPVTIGAAAIIGLVLLFAKGK